MTASTAVQPDHDVAPDAAARAVREAIAAAGLTDRLDTYDTAAKFLQVHPAHVRRLVRRGEFPVCRFGRSVRMWRSDLIAYVEAHRVPARDGAA